MERRVAGGRNGLIRSMAPMPEAIFGVILICRFDCATLNSHQ